MSNVLRADWHSWVIVNLSNTSQGQFVNNFPHGFGSYTWPDMSYYEGNIYQGLRHGSGFFVGPPGENIFIKHSK